MLTAPPSPAQAPQLVDVERQAAAEDRDDQAEADDDLAGCDHHHHQGEDLAVGVADHPREGDERQVARVQHQLEAEQDHQRAAPDQHASGADREQKRGQDEVPLDGHQAAPPVGSDGSAVVERSGVCRLGRPCGSCRRPASTTAATAASSSRIDAASNAIRNFSSSSSPMSAGCPKPSGTSGPSSPSVFSDEPSTAIDSSTNSAPPSNGASSRWPGIGSQTGSSTPPT